MPVMSKEHKKCKYNNCRATTTTTQKWRGERFYFVSGFLFLRLCAD